MSDQYNQMSPQADKVIHADGSITTLDGTELYPPDEGRAAQWEQMSPSAAKWLLPDGSISDTVPVGGGGTAAHVTADDTGHTDVKGGNVQAQLDSTDTQVHGLKEIIAGSSQLFHTDPAWEADDLATLQSWVQPDDTAYDPINERVVNNFDIYLALDTNTNYYFDSNAWVPLAPTPEAGIDIIKVFAPDSTTLNITLSQTPVSTVEVGSFMVYDMITGNPVTVSEITGGAANYVLTVTQSRGVGVTFLGN